MSEKQYVNEHLLAVLMSSFKNYDGATYRKLRRDPDQKLKRAKFDLARAAYESALLEFKGDKRKPAVQETFKEMLALSVDIIPSDKEIEELYRYIREISRRCIGLYGRNRGLDFEDIAVMSFERWMKYKKNFDPLKRSDITGTRVNSFSYMTQLIKNNIYEMSTKVKRQQDLEKMLADGWAMMFEEEVLGEEQNANSDFKIIQALTVEATNHSNFEDFMKAVSTKHEIDPDLLVQVIEAYQLADHFKEILTTNRWAW